MAIKNANTGNQYGSKSPKMGMKATPIKKPVGSPTMGMKARQIRKPISGSTPTKRGGGLGTGSVGGNNRKGR